MPKTPTILTVFVASPDDVKEERAESGKVIQELNDTWGDHLGIRLELVRWETHAYPGLADDAQAVIKEEIPADYDIFVGIAWTRLGTPTKRGQSGTAEEFELAYKRFEDNPKQVRIMFYFKVKPVSPMELDLEQASRLEKFRQKLGEQGTLWWTFSELEDFRNFARIHLSRQVQTWGKSWGAGTALTPVKPTAPPETEPPADLESEEAEEGFLDLIETSVSSIERASETVTRINSATEELNGKITMKTARLQELNARADTGLAAKKRLINEVANDMEEFVARLRANCKLIYGKNRLDLGA